MGSMIHHSTSIRFNSPLMPPSSNMAPDVGHTTSRHASCVLTSIPVNLAGDRDRESRQQKKRKNEDDFEQVPVSKRLCPDGTKTAQPPPNHDESYALAELLKPPILVTPYPRNIMAKTQTLQPLFLLRRGDVPLSYLDLCDIHGELGSSRLVESHIKPLELGHGPGSIASLLVAASESTRNLYVLERYSRGIYTACKLGSWVNLMRISETAEVCCHPALKIFAASPKGKKNASPFLPPLETPEGYREAKEKQRAIAQLREITRKPSRSCSTPVLPTTDSAQSCDPKSGDGESSLVRPAPQALTALPTSDDLAEKSPALKYTASDLFDNIHSQYIELLYRSKGSLAYFAKGPLARARAAFQLSNENGLLLADLVQFLQGLVMTTVVMDKKYRENIPRFVDGLTALVGSSDDENRKKPKKRTKKMKIGKNSLYPGEEEHIEKWWRLILKARETQTPEADAITPDEMWHHIDNLRTRETMLQIVIIMEILALEPLVQSRAAELPLLPDSNAKQPGPNAAPRKRNKHNFALLLDVHVDRLCIWQSTAAELSTVLGNSQVVWDAAAATGPSGPDMLKDFCVDVIIPFFSARLQQQCDSLCRKLGGPPQAAWTQQSKLTKLAQTNSAATLVRPTPTKSVSAVRRPVLAKAQTSSNLEHALSQDRARRSMSKGPGSGKHLAALRAATVSVGPKIKREGSICSVSSGRDNLVQASPALLGCSFSQAESKLQKKAMVETELRDAITAIKRPSRDLLRQTLADESDRTMASHGGKIKHFGNRTQIQVKATPANTRFKDMLGRHGSQSHKLESRVDINVSDFDLDCLPSSDLAVPLSVPRRRGTTDMALPGCVAATPLKPATTSNNLPTLKATTDSEESDPPQSSPTVPSRKQLFRSRTEGNVLDSGTSRLDLDKVFTTISQTPVKKETTITPPSNRLSKVPLLLTNSRLPLDSASTSSATRTVAAAHPVKQSIFQTLGWEDDF